MSNDETVSLIEQHNLIKKMDCENPGVGILRYVKLLRHIKGYKERGIMVAVDTINIENDILSEIELLAQKM